MVQFCYSRLYFEIVGPKTVSCSLLLRMVSTWIETRKSWGNIFKFKLNARKNHQKNITVSAIC